jgi:site-specific recombinase XerD
MQLDLLSVQVPSPSASRAASPPPCPADKQIEAFVLSAIDNQGTRRAYRTHLMKAFRTMNIDRLEDVTPRHLAALRAAIIGSTLASATQAQALSALRAFLAWSSLDTPLPFSLDAARRLLRLPTVSTNAMPAVLSDEEAQKVLELADEPSGERAMVMVLLGAGLRISELCALDCQDVVTEVHFAILRVHGKGGKQRLVPVHPPVVGAIERYLAVSHRSLRSEGPEERYRFFWLKKARRSAAAAPPPQPPSP